MITIHPNHRHAQYRPGSRLTACSNPQRLFAILTRAIANADVEGDDRAVDLLLTAKMAAVRRHHTLLSEGR